MATRLQQGLPQPWRQHDAMGSGTSSFAFGSPWRAPMFRPPASAPAANSSPATVIDSPLTGRSASEKPSPYIGKNAGNCLSGTGPAAVQGIVAGKAPPAWYSAEEAETQAYPDRVDVGIEEDTQLYDDDDQAVVGTQFYEDEPCRGLANNGYFASEQTGFTKLDASSYADQAWGHTPHNHRSSSSSNRGAHFVVGSNPRPEAMSMASGFSTILAQACEINANFCDSLPATQAYADGFIEGLNSGLVQTTLTAPSKQSTSAFCSKSKNEGLEHVRAAHKSSMMQARACVLNDNFCDSLPATQAYADDFIEGLTSDFVQSAIAAPIKLNTSQAGFICRTEGAQRVDNHNLKFEAAKTEYVLSDPLPETQAYEDCPVEFTSQVQRPAAMSSVEQGTTAGVSSFEEKGAHHIVDANLKPEAARTEDVLFDPLPATQAYADGPVELTPKFQQPAANDTTTLGSSDVRTVADATNSRFRARFPPIPREDPHQQSLIRVNIMQNPSSPSPHDELPGTQLYGGEPMPGEEMKDQSAPTPKEHEDDLQIQATPYYGDCFPQKTAHAAAEACEPMPATQQYTFDASPQRHVACESVETSKVNSHFTPDASPPVTQQYVDKHRERDNGDCMGDAGSVRHCADELAATQMYCERSPQSSKGYSAGLCAGVQDDVPTDTGDVHMTELTVRSSRGQGMDTNSISIKQTQHASVQQASQKSESTEVPEFQPKVLAAIFDELADEDVPKTGESTTLPKTSLSASMQMTPDQGGSTVEVANTVVHAAPTTPALSTAHEDKPGDKTGSKAGLRLPRARKSSSGLAPSSSASATGSNTKVSARGAQPVATPARSPMKLPRFAALAASACPEIQAVALVNRHTKQHDTSAASALPEDLLLCAEAQSRPPASVMPRTAVLQSSLPATSMNESSESAVIRRPSRKRLAAEDIAGNGGGSKRSRSNACSASGKAPEGTSSSSSSSTCGLLLQSTSASSACTVPKRRRLVGKQPPPQPNPWAVPEVKPVCFAVTGFLLGKKRTSFLTDTLGAKVVAEWSPEVTHLISDTFRRTTKFMCAIVAGARIVVPAFIDACRDAGRIVDDAPFALRDPVCETAFATKQGLQRYTLQAALERARRKGPLLKDIFVYVHRRVANRDELQVLVKAAGGQWCRKIPTKAELKGAEVLLIGTVYDPELLREGACTQELRRDLYRI